MNIYNRRKMNGMTITEICFEVNLKSRGSKGRSPDNAEALS